MAAAKKKKRKVKATEKERAAAKKKVSKMGVLEFKSQFTNLVVDTKPTKKKNKKK